MAENLKITVRDNVRAILGLKKGEAGIQKLKELGISNGNAQRILGGETNLGLGLLADLAQALHVEPWQLCVPGLDPDRLPRLHEAKVRWPFRRIDQEVISGLVGTIAASVENGLLATLATVGISPRKLPDTGT